MEQPDPFGFIGLTYDDVMLLPGHTDVIPSEADTTSRLTRRIDVAAPLLSAAMDTVTESRMAIAMARNGGIGILHRNLSIEDQSALVDKVKRSESGMITNPVTTTPDATVAEVDALCGQFRVSGLPVIEGDGKLVGIITNRDMRFVSPFEKSTTLVRDVMTKSPLITAPEGVDPDSAVAIFAQHKIEKLPLVDKDGRLRGLITVKDFDKSEKYPNATKDESGDFASVLRSASSETRGIARSRSTRRASTSSSWTPRTVTPPVCSTSSGDSRRTGASPTSISSAATARPALVRSRWWMPARTRSRWALAPAPSAPLAWSRVSEFRRSRPSTRHPSRHAKAASRSSRMADCSTPVTSPRHS